MVGWACWVVWGEGGWGLRPASPVACFARGFLAAGRDRSHKATSGGGPLSVLRGAAGGLVAACEHRFAEGKS